MMKNLVNEKPVPGNAVQLTGGEPCLREDLIDIIKIYKQYVDHVQLNTDGIKISQDLEFSKKVREAGVDTIYLSFDGVSEKANKKNYLEAPKAIKNCREVGLGIVLVPTVINTENDSDIGKIVKYASNNIDTVRGIIYQPISFTGRVTRAEIKKKYRITIPDVIQKIEEQTNGEITKKDFYPVPFVTSISDFIGALYGKRYELTSHFACGMATYVFKKDNKLIPITQFVDVEGLKNYLDEKTNELKLGKSKNWIKVKVLSNLSKFIDKNKSPINIGKIIFNSLFNPGYDTLGEFHHRSLLIGMMHFQDKSNYDVERTKRCCIHYLLDDLIIPFCAFNVIPEKYRDRLQKERGISLEEWERMTGRKLSDDLYKRKINI